MAAGLEEVLLPFSTDFLLTPFALTAIETHQPEVTNNIKRDKKRKTLEIPFLPFIETTFSSSLFCATTY